MDALNNNSPSNQ